MKYQNRHSMAGRIQSRYDPNLPWFMIVDRLKNSIPGSTCHIDTTGISNIDQFCAELALCDSTVDNTIVTDELWKFIDEDTGINHYEICLNQYANDNNKNVVILTHGYTDRQIGPRCWMFSYPIYFLISDFYRSHPAVKPTGLEYGFSSLNRRMAVHRVLLGYHLYDRGLLDQVIFSLGGSDMHPYQIYETLPNFKKFLELIPITCYDNNRNDHTVNHPAYTDAYCNIVTETETDRVVDVMPGTNYNEFEIITEKSYKPFMSRQIPLFLASRGHMDYLKKLGFEVMEDLVPVGYDHMLVQDKIQAVLEIVGRGRDWIESFYFDHLSEIEHNYQLVMSNRVQDRLISNISTVLSN